MEPIPVPAPPKSAFNKNRRVSDLLLSQLRHFQHVAHKHGIELDPALESDIYSEGGAARYITSITRALRGGSQRPEGKPVLAPRIATLALRKQSSMVDLAAEAATTSQAPAAKKPKTPRPSRKAKTSKKS